MRLGRKHRTKGNIKEGAVQRTRKGTLEVPRALGVARGAVEGFRKETYTPGWRSGEPCAQDPSWGSEPGLDFKAQ